ncbi:retrovirus-related pol polyprotein from transposon [Cystoisospora suis]|uniref:Retrovirus-related pol polyprotein from transposon n=1 Tax=Cystoisospora suis TaxID=483139 RepID=A0A2C6L7M8_9APIC|nr:retrovirus-related pol polyprotein from transposon [Cystoisospora suis]
MADHELTRGPTPGLPEEVNGAARRLPDILEGSAQGSFVVRSGSPLPDTPGVRPHQPSSSTLPAGMDHAPREHRLHNEVLEVPPPADGAILAPATNLKAFKELRLLPHDDDDEDLPDKVDLEKWFEDFQSACWRGHGSGAIHQFWWLDQLLLQATAHARHHINSILTDLSRDRPHLNRFEQYVEVRDSLLLEQPDRYSTVAYFDQLMALRPGERRALVLQRHINRLWTHYEVARARDAKAVPPKVMPSLTEYFVTLLYSRALKSATRAGIPPLSVFVAEGQSQLLVRYAQRAAAFEAANPPANSYVIAGALDDAEREISTGVGRRRTGSTLSGELAFRPSVREEDVRYGVSTLSSSGAFRIVAGGAANEAVDAFVLKPFATVARGLAVEDPTRPALKRRKVLDDPEEGSALFVESPCQSVVDRAIGACMACSALEHVEGAWVVPGDQLRVTGTVASTCRVHETDSAGKHGLCNFPETHAQVMAMCERAEALNEADIIQLKRLCSRYETIWNAGDRPLSKTNLTTFKVELQEGVLPISCSYRPVSADKRRRIALLVSECLASGLCVPSDSEWASAVVLAPKPGGKDRLCIDYRKLNSVTRVPTYPLPRIQQALDALQGKTFFSVFDFPNAYWQIEVEPESRKFLAFITPDGHYEWTRMPFGAAAAPATQQRMIDKLLGGMKWVCAIAYLDDVVVFSDTFADHLKHLEAFFVKVKEANLQLKPQKSNLCRSETCYLGFLVSAKGVRPDPSKTAPIARFPVPKDVKSVRSFLGIGSYYRRFIRDYARKAEPLQRLLTANAEFRWGAEQEKAFENIKLALVNATLMAHPQPGKPFVIDCDASILGLGAALSQPDERGLERPIAFASRALRPNEQKWTITELEAFAVVWALESFRVWVEGSPTLVRTDHSPLLWLRNNAGKSTRIARWVLRLQDFAFDLQHKAGRCNAVADALSRYPTGEVPAKSHATMCDVNYAARTDALCAVVNPAERCRECWGQHNAFSAGGGTVLITEQPTTQTVRIERANRPESELVGEETIRHLQKLDPECIETRQYLAGVDGARPPMWSVRAGMVPAEVDGVLCFKSTDPQHSDKRPLILLPQVARTAVVQRLHLGQEAGHFGRKKTIARIRARYIWGSIARDVARVLSTCSQCWQQAKDGARNIPGRTLPKGWPGEVIAMDLFGPLPLSRKGFLLILVIIDHFSRWVDLTALRKAEAADVVEVLRNKWIPQHGVPRLILSDNGPQFVADVVQRLCRGIGARKLYSTPYHPKGNSVVESFMRTLKKALGALVDEDGRDWDRHLQAVALAHNSTPHTATGFSPFFLEHGREAVLPVQRYLDEPRLDPVSVSWLERLWRSRLYVYEAHAMEEKRQKELCGSARSLLPPGAIVAVRLSPADAGEYPAKLAPRWAGPWVVCERFGNDKTYKVRDVCTKAEKQVSRDQLKLLDLPAEPGSIWPFPRVRLDDGAVGCNNLPDHAARDAVRPYSGSGARPAASPALQPPPEQDGTGSAGVQIPANRQCGNGEAHPITQSRSVVDGTTATGQIQHEPRQVVDTAMPYGFRPTASRRSRAVEEARGFSGPARRGRRYL